MLIWIKAPYAAIGVLASFVLLLSTVVSEQVDLNTNSENFENITAAQELDSVQLMDLPFSRSLENPCSWSSSNGETSPYLIGTRNEFMEEYYTYIKHYSRVYREEIEGMLKNHSIANCADLHVGNLPHTPTLAELKEMSMGEALNKIYLSLLMHSAYSFVAHHEVSATNIRCSNDVKREQNLATRSRHVALRHKSLSCYVLVGINVLEFEKDDVMPHLNINITDLSLCSRRALRHCQVLNSAQKFLGILHNYATDSLSGSFTSFPSSTLSTSPIYSTLKAVSTSSTASQLPITSSTPSTISPSSVSFISSTLSTSSSTPNSLAPSSSITSTILNILISSTVSTSLSAPTETSTGSASTTRTTDS